MLPPLHRRIRHVPLPRIPQRLQQPRDGSTIAHPLIPILYQLQHQLPPLLSILRQRERTTNVNREHSAPHNCRLDIRLLILRFHDRLECLVHGILDIRAQREIPILHGLQEQLGRRPEHLAREEAGPLRRTRLWLVRSREGRQVQLDFLHPPNQLPHRQVSDLLVPPLPIRDERCLCEGPHHRVCAAHRFKHAIPRCRADGAPVRAEEFPDVVHQHWRLLGGDGSEDVEPYRGFDDELVLVVSGLERSGVAPHKGRVVEDVFGVLDSEGEEIVPSATTAIEEIERDDVEGSHRVVSGEPALERQGLLESSDGADGADVFQD